VQNQNVAKSPIIHARVPQWVFERLQAESKVQRRTVSQLVALALEAHYSAQTADKSKKKG
jgi:hypothetical protein